MAAFFSPGGGSGHALCLVRWTDLPRGFDYYRVEEGVYVSAGEPVRPGYYVPIDYQVVGGSSSAVKQGQGNGTPGWGFSLFGYSMEGPKMVDEEDPVDQYFPWEVVEQSLRDPGLERRHGVKQEYLVEARSCPKCEAPPEELRWIYVREAPDPLGVTQSREGYLLVCDKCRIQADFFWERRS